MIVVDGTTTATIETQKSTAQTNLMTDSHNDLKRDIYVFFFIFAEI
jgi:hypothetical protein